MNAVNINYDELLVGHVERIDANNFYGLASEGQTEREAIDCIRYVIEKVLLWTPEEAIKKFDEYTIRTMKLDKVIQYINFPTEIPDGNPKYVLSLLYPSKIKIDPKKMTEAVFQSVLDAITKEDAPLKQFPREYFFGGEGFNRFCICVAYLIDNYKPMDSVEEIYEFFDSPDGKRFLYNYRLKVPADQFAINMIDVIRYITRDEEDGEMMYNFFKFNKLYSKYLKNRNRS